MNSRAYCDKTVTNPESSDGNESAEQNDNDSNAHSIIVTIVTWEVVDRCRSRRTQNRRARRSRRVRSRDPNQIYRI